MILDVFLVQKFHGDIYCSFNTGSGYPASRRMIPSPVSMSLDGGFET